MSVASTSIRAHQAVTVATGHILHYKSEFRADGYSLGDLLYSLPLAPGQKKQIVVFDSMHTLRGSESQSLSQGERLSANIVDEREIADQLGGGINEALSGSSSAISNTNHGPKHQIDTAKIRGLGMIFGGEQLLRRTVQELIDEHRLANPI